MATAPGWLALLLVLTGGAAVPWLTHRGLVLLDEASSWRTVRVGTVAAGAAAGWVAAAAYRYSGAWTVLVFAGWAAAIAAAACCDVVTMRMPTTLLRVGAALTLVLVAVAAAVSRHSAAPLIVGLLVALLAAGVVALGWRFGAVGYGDVRLALLGGLPMGFVPASAVLPAGLAFAAVCLLQATVALIRGGSRKTRLPFGAALAAMFLVAACAG